MLLTHGDSVDTVAPGFRVIAKSGNLVAGKIFLFLFEVICLVYIKNVCVFLV